MDAIYICEDKHLEKYCNFYIICLDSKTKLLYSVEYALWDKCELPKIWIFALFCNIFKVCFFTNYQIYY